MMKFKTVVLCLKLLTCLIVQRSFGNLFVYDQQKIIELNFCNLWSVNFSNNDCGLEICPKAFSEPWKIYKKKDFAKIVNG